MSQANGALHSLERNRFYYQKLMGVRQWTVEQDYGIEARRLLSRLGLGVGVLCGLGVRMDANGCVVIEPGVAIDGRGREIIVPHEICIEHPEQPTDCMGKPDGDPVTDGIVTIVLCYHECLTEPSSAVACGCDTVERCEHGMVVERYCVRVDRGRPDRPPPFPCEGIFSKAPDAAQPAMAAHHVIPEEIVVGAPVPADHLPQAQPSSRRRKIWEVAGKRCAAASDDCVVLATIAYREGRAPLLDPFRYRRTIYSNQTLFELIMCLAARVDECCGHHEEPPVARAARVMQAWPSDAMDIPSTQQDRDTYIKRPRLELVIERPVSAAALAQPDDWLRAWSIHGLNPDGPMMRRIALTRDEPTVETPMLVPQAGEQLEVYAFDAKYRREMRSGVVLVQLRPDGDGAARIAVDDAAQLLLDAEHHGTGLSQQRLDDAWAITDTTTDVPVNPAFLAALKGVPPALPSGEGNEGGHLDMVFGFALPNVPEVEHQPRLRALWPPSASYLHVRDGGDEAMWRNQFQEVPRLELTIDDKLAQQQFEGPDPRDWIGVWQIRENAAGGVTLRRIDLTHTNPNPNPVLPAPPDTVTYVLRLDQQGIDLGEGRHRYVVAMLTDPPAFDGDWTGIPGMTPDDVRNLVANDAWPFAGVGPDGPSSLGQMLFDGNPGGWVAAYFDFSPHD